MGGNSAEGTPSTQRNVLNAVAQQGSKPQVVWAGIITTVLLGLGQTWLGQSDNKQIVDTAVEAEHATLSHVKQNTDAILMLATDRERLKKENYRSARSIRRALRRQEEELDSLRRRLLAVTAAPVYAPQPAAIRHRPPPQPTYAYETPAALVLPMVVPAEVTETAVEGEGDLKIKALRERLEMRDRVAPVWSSKKKLVDE
jgi:hypothetical protein